MVKQRWRGRFFGLRIDCEQVPLLSAPIVRRILADPDWNRYQLIWLNQWTGVIEDLVWVKRVVAPCFPNVEAIVVERLGKVQLTFICSAGRYRVTVEMISSWNAQVATHCGELYMDGKRGA